MLLPQWWKNKQIQKSVHVQTRAADVNVPVNPVVSRTEGPICKSAKLGAHPGLSISVWKLRVVEGTTREVDSYQNLFGSQKLQMDEDTRTCRYVCNGMHVGVYTCLCIYIYIYVYRHIYIYT